MKYLVIFEFSWQFGFGAFAAYLIGIAVAVFDVSAFEFFLASVIKVVFFGSTKVPYCFMTISL
jgi:hypothetical protein